MIDLENNNVDNNNLINNNNMDNNINDENDFVNLNKIELVETKNENVIAIPVKSNCSKFTKNKNTNDDKEHNYIPHRHTKRGKIKLESVTNVPGKNAYISEFKDIIIAAGKEEGKQVELIR